MWIEDANGNRTEVTEAHWNRWRTQLKDFRPVAEKKKGAIAPAEPPTGDKTEEN